MSVCVRVRIDFQMEWNGMICFRLRNVLIVCFVLAHASNFQLQQCLNVGNSNEMLIDHQIPSVHVYNHVLTILYMAHDGSSSFIGEHAVFVSFLT